MTRYFLSLFIALILHIIFIIIFLTSIKLIHIDKKTKSDDKKKIKISLKELHIEKKEPIKKKVLTKIKQQIKPIKKAPPIPKGKQLKKTLKTIKAKPKHINKPKITTKQKTKPFVKEYIKHEKKESIKPKQKPKPIDPMAWLYEDKSAQEDVKKVVSKSTNSSSINQNIKELYGSKFTTLTKVQQDYILDNQEIMRRITQEILNRVASVNIKGNIRVNTSNVVEFVLHPNGDMTDFRFLSKSNYFEIDDTTRETIEYAYSKYPRPKEKTLIRYNVFYNLRY